MENRRIWEIDLLRAVAIMFMVTFHLIFDLNEFLGIDIDYLSGFWYWEGKVSALIFIFIAGLSSGFSKNPVKRGVKVLAFGILISIVTYIIFKEEYIRFGILHFLGTSMILFPVLKNLNNVVLFIITVIIAISGLYIDNFSAYNGILLPLGVMYNGFASIDYYPLIPYLSVFILGILAYKIYYYKKQSFFKFNFENENIKFISKNSLTIYLIHQPVLILMLVITKFFL